MTDEQIIKGLKCCLENGDCAECPYNGGDIKDCIDSTTRDAYNLILRLKGEIANVKSNGC